MNPINNDESQQRNAYELLIDGVHVAGQNEIQVKMILT